MKIIRYGQESFYLEERAIHDERRQPIVNLPEYRVKFSVSDWSAPGFDNNSDSAKHKVII
jgi:hypothetical protein